MRQTKSVFHECWATKRGGKHQSWKSRYFVLVNGVKNPKAAEFFYFTSAKAKSATGVITITEKSSVKLETIQKGKKNINCISIGSGVLGSRVFYLYCDNPADQDKCVKALSDKIKQLQEANTAKPPSAMKNMAAGGGGGGGNAAGAAPAGQQQQPQKPTQAHNALKAAKSAIPAALSETANDFWEIWTQSIPSSDAELNLSLSTTPDMSELTWRVTGPQQVLIQDMVDFFWNVGAPDEEIDRLNNIGGVINPAVIGSWIDMSTLGGMDGGWIFPGEMNINDGLEACDEGSARSKLSDWLKSNNFGNGVLLARDMGASPPRQTEIRVALNFDFAKSWELVLSALKAFNVPDITSEYKKAIQKWSPKKIDLSVVTSSEGFVRIGLIFPEPNSEVVDALGGGHNRPFMDFQKNIKKEPSHVEIQFLMNGFGYAVYQEGYKIKLHYAL
jgi:hypothetical protein